MRKVFIYCFAILIPLLSCNTAEEENELIASLKADIIDLQKEIRAVSNELEFYSLDPSLSYQSPDVAASIMQFTTARESQKSKIATLENSYNETTDIEHVVCADFEEMACFIENWEIRKPDDGILKFDSTCSYNNSNSLYLSSPFIANAVNLPFIEIEGFVNGIEDQSIYKVRWWAKYQGTADQGNGPVMYMTVIQDGEWLDYLYEGNSSGQYVEKDWALYSFQIATKSASPLEIIFGTNLEHCYIDDIHIVKKDD